MKIREFHEEDVTKIQSIYQEAFKGFPWYENLSIEEVNRRWKMQSDKPGSNCLVAEIGQEIVGATWWDRITREQLLNERGEALVEFVKGFSGCDLVWLRETCVSPKFQGQGIAYALKQEVIEILGKSKKLILVLTRMREDNIGIISINTNLGFKQIGIKVPSSQIEGLFHEYWYKKI